MITATQGKKINMVGFEKTKAFLKEVLDRNVLNEDIKPYYENTYNILTINLNLQKEVINLVDQYDSFINKKRGEDNNRFFPDDVDFVQSILAQLDYIQYKQLGNSIKGFDDFSYINEDLNTNSRVQEYVTPEVKGYIKEFSKDKEVLHQEIQKITYFKEQDKLTKEEHIDKVKERYNEMQRTYLQGLKEDIRNLD
ncbi:hypothetical protein [Piscibacillus salipiscarius]|uniref:Uncharacterized protein n=1 Tax=Piscibacillus salipiscarius TaxID=299480 RepID=A0ABW5QB91_9BACI